MEDGLKRLDKLTQEEVRMAIAQNLEAIHTVDERVRGVMLARCCIEACIVESVASVEESVACFDERVVSAGA